MSNKTIIFYCFVFLSSCVTGSGAYNANVEVIVNPYGGGENFRRSTPIIITAPAEMTCRPRSYNVQDLRTNLGTAGLSLDGWDNILGELSEVEGVEVTPAIRRERSKPIRVSVSSNWTKIGLSIANNSQFFLVINTVEWRATGYHDGQTYSAEGTLGDNYCSGLEGGFPFLYFLPPKHKIDYKPQSRNSPLENLTLYLDGFPIVDRSGDLSARATQILNRGGEGGGSATTQEILRPGDRLIDIPNYNVDLTLIGQFLNEDGENITSGFSKRVSFNVTKDFTIY